MVLGIVMTVILLLSGLSLCLTGMGRMTPLGVRLLPFVEAALLWLYVLPRGNKGWLGILFLVQFYLMSGIVVIAAASGLIGEVLDRERNIDPVTLGNPRGEKTIVAIYHPGGSDFTWRVLREIGDRLAGTEYKMVLYSARRGLRIDLSRAEAVALASPVYGGQIRPPVKRFIERGLAGSKCFLVLTGGGTGAEENELAQVVPLMQARGGTVLAKAKFAPGKDKSALKEQAAAFAAQMVGELAKS